jgi:ribosomal protein S1
MGKTVTVSIPSWVDEDEFRRIVDKVVKRLEGRVPVEELRRRLGVRPEDLVEDLDAVDVEALEARERERLSL